MQSSYFYTQVRKKTQKKSFYAFFKLEITFYNIFIVPLQSKELKWQTISFQ